MASMNQTGRVCLGVINYLLLKTFYSQVKFIFVEGKVVLACDWICVCGLHPPPENLISSLGSFKSGGGRFFLSMCESTVVNEQ